MKKIHQILRKPKPAASASRLAALLAAFLLGAVPAASSIGGPLPAPPQNRPVALIGGTIHTITNGTVENGTILFENGTITAIGTGIDLPGGTHEVHISGRHVYPGLIEAHSQLGLYEIGAVDMTIDSNEFGRINPNVRAEVAFHPESRHIGVARSNGVLIAVAAPAGGLISGLSAAMMLDGWTWETMLIRRSTGLIVNWPSPGDEGDYEKEIRELRDAFADARSYRNARRAMENGASAGHRHESDSRWEAMIPVLSREVPVVVAANDLRQIQDAISWAEEEEVRLVLLGGRDARFVSDHLARKDIPVIVTSVLASPSRDWQPYDSAYGLPGSLHEAGIRFAIAGASSAPNAHRLPYEAGAAIAYGLPEAEALRAVTLYPARILGLDDRVGSLEPGKDATLLITDGNPLEYRTQVFQAYIEGREIDMADAHLQLYEKYSEKVRQWQESR